jgi:DedD protein
MTKTADKDEQLELKKRARRRLVGAIVFVSVAAVVLPLVMDEEPPPVAGGIELHIPAQEKGYTPPAVALAPPGQSAPVPAAEPVAVPAAPEPAPASLPAPAAVPVGGDAKPDAKPDAKADVKAEAKSEPALAKAALPKAVPGKPSDPAVGDAKRAQAILDGKPGSKGVSGQYIVLIGAFANPGNVQVIQKKLGEMGIRVYTEALDTPQGRKIRVRAGPFASHDAAEKAAARMKKIGVGGIVATKS